MGNELHNKNKELDGLLSTVKQFSDDISMNIKLDKCANVTFRKGKLTPIIAVEFDNDTAIRELYQEETYKYLGIDERNEIQDVKLKEKIRKKKDKERVLQTSKSDIKNGIEFS